MSVEKKLCGVYCIENLINCKKYIGQSTDIIQRWKTHKTELNCNRHRNSHLQKSWNLYGEDNFKFYLLEECSEDKLDEKEIYYIGQFNTTNGNLGYNKESGGHIGKHMSIESRMKMSDAKSNVFGEKNSFFGKKHTDEAKQKMSEAHKKENLSKETLRKLRENHADFSGSNSSKARAVYCLELDMTFGAMTEASKYTNAHFKGISNCVCGKAKSAGKHPTTGEPLHWYYADQIPDDIKAS